MYLGEIGTDKKLTVHQLYSKIFKLEKEIETIRKDKSMKRRHHIFPMECRIEEYKKRINELFKKDFYFYSGFIDEIN